MDGAIGYASIANNWATFLTDPDITNEGPLPYPNFTWAESPIPSNNGGTWQSFAGPFEYIEQSVELVEGLRYILDIEYVSQQIVRTVDNDTLFDMPTGLKVTFDNDLEFQSDIDSTFFTWENSCFSFVASQSISTIRISGISDFGYLGVDGICLYRDINQIDYPDTILCIDEFLDVDLNGIKVIDASWQGFDQDINKYTFSDAGQYWLNVEDTCGSYIDKFNLNFEDCGCQLFVPNVFSPLAAGSNNRFNIATTCSLQEFDLRVFDRWGNDVFSSNSILNPWDGTCCQIGTYIFQIIYSFDGINTKVLSGDVNYIK